MSDVSQVNSADAHPTAGPSSTARASAPNFQAMLDRLQRLTSEQPRAEDVDTPETLQRALQTADDGFVAAMDLRRQLEEAFQRHSA